MGSVLDDSPVWRLITNLYIMTSSRGVHSTVDGDYVSSFTVLVLSDYVSLSTIRYIQYKVTTPRFVLKVWDLLLDDSPVGSSITKVVHHDYVSWCSLYSRW